MDKFRLLELNLAFVTGLFMNLSKLFASNIIWRGTYLFTSLLVTVLLARFFEASATGWLFYFISLLTLCFMLGSFSMEASVTYFVSGGEINDRKMQSFVLAWTLFISLISVIVSFLLIRNGSDYVSKQEQIVMAVLFISGNLLITFYNALFYAKQNYRTPNIVFIVFNLVLISILLIGMLSKEHIVSYQLFLWIYFLSYPLQGLVTTILYNGMYHSGFNFHLPDRAQLKQVFRYSLLAFMANMIFFLVTRVDYWLIELFTHDHTALGNYIQSSRLVQLFQLFPAILASSIFPLAASGYKEQMKEGIERLSRIIVLLYILASGVLALIGHWLFPFVFGESYGSMYVVFLWLVPGLFALSLLALMAAYFAAINQVKINIITSLVGLLVIVIADLLLIPVYGIIGAAAASSVGYLVCFFVALYYFNKETNVGLMDLLFFRKTDVDFLRNLVTKITENKTN